MGDGEWRHITRLFGSGYNYHTFVFRAYNAYISSHGISVDELMTWQLVRTDFEHSHCRERSVTGPKGWI